MRTLPECVFGLEHRILRGVESIGACPGFIKTLLQILNPVSERFLTLGQIGVIAPSGLLALAVLAQAMATRSWVFAAAILAKNIA